MALPFLKTYDRVHATRLVRQTERLGKPATKQFFFGAALKERLREELYGGQTDSHLVINPETDALIVVDAQPTFMPGGGLAVPNGDAIVPHIRDLMKLFPKENRFATKDWHPKGHISLASSYVGLDPMTVLTPEVVADWSEAGEDRGKYLASGAQFTVTELKEYLDKVGFQVLWPDHGIQNTAEAALHPSLPESDFAYVQIKGTEPGIDSYSGFYNNTKQPTGLADVLKARGIKRVFVVGLAQDYCVGWTATGATRNEFESLVVEDATASVGFPVDQIQKTLLAFRDRGVRLISKTGQVMQANEGLPTLLLKVAAKRWKAFRSAHSTGKPVEPEAIPELAEKDLVSLTTESIEEAQTAFQSGEQERTWFELTAPAAPHGGSYIVSAGIEDALMAIHERRIGKPYIKALRATSRYSGAFLKYLSNFEFTGDIQAVPEGRVVAPGEPILRIRATAVEKALLQDLLMNRIGGASAVATKTARIVQAADGRPVSDYGLRRGPGEGAAAASEATIIGGARASSNVRVGETTGIDITGTMAHLFITSWPPEQEADAFRAYAKAFPDSAIFLVDTYDTEQGIRNAIVVAKEMERDGHKLYGIRLDSGDLEALSKQARQMLDDAGLPYVKVGATNDLDEDQITKLLDADSPIDFFGVGTNMITGGTQASVPLTLAAAPDTRAWRITKDGEYVKDVRVPSTGVPSLTEDETATELLAPFWQNGKRVREYEPPTMSRDLAAADLAALPPSMKALQDAEPMTVRDEAAAIRPPKGKLVFAPVPVSEQDHPVPFPDETVALVLDTYHLKMAQAFWKAGLHKTPTTFDYFYRTPPFENDQVVVSGTKLLVDKLPHFKFSPRNIEYLRSIGKFDEDFLKYLEGYEFCGDIDALPEGTLAFGHEPIMRVSGTILEAALVESFLLSKMNYNSLVATRASILRRTETGPLIDDSLTVTQGLAQLEAARSAHLGGVDYTTNLDAHVKFGIPLAFPDTPGKRLKEDPATGGPKLAMGGVYKLSVWQGIPRQKLSQTAGKTSNPGLKTSHDITDADGTRETPLLALDGEPLELRIGQQARPRLVPAIRKGRRVYDGGSLSDIRGRNADQHEGHSARLASRTGIELSAGLRRLKQALIDLAHLERTPPEDRGVRIALAQVNVTIGDFKGVAQKARMRIVEAEQKKTDLLIFQETLLTGYPAGDEWFNPEFQAAQDRALKDVVDSTRGKDLTVVLGAVETQPDGSLMNAAHVIRDGQIVKTVYKHHLATGEVYNDPRQFKRGPSPAEAMKLHPPREGDPGGNLIEVKGVKFGICICEDMWQEHVNIVRELKEQGATDIISINGSHYYGGEVQVLRGDDPSFDPESDFEVLGARVRFRGSKVNVRKDLLQQRSYEHGVNIFYTNGAAGQDQIVLDGHGMVYNAQGEMVASGRHFDEDLFLVERGKDGRVTAVDDETVRGHLPLSSIDQAYEATVVGLADYLRKSGMKRVVIGLSGGVDSSVSAAVAVDAMARLGLPRTNVIGISMPSKFSSRGSKDDARVLAESLGISYQSVTIRWLFVLALMQFGRLLNRLLQTLSDLPGRGSKNWTLALENIQPRMRAMILFFVANLYGESLVLSCSNDTEMRRGYSTLGGDIEGGYAPLANVNKLLVYMFGIHRNRQVRQGRKTGLIPQAVFDKAPSAELKPGQTDETAFGFPYYLLVGLDQVLQRERGNLTEVIRQRNKIDVNGELSDERFARLIFNSLTAYIFTEHKRRQGAPGAVVTARSHSYGDQRPIAVANYHDYDDILRRVKEARTLGFLREPRQLALASDGGPIRFTLDRFADGEINIVNLDSKRTADREVTLRHGLSSSDDVVEILLILENLSYYKARRINLELERWRPETHADQQLLRLFRSFADGIRLEEQGGAMMPYDVTPARRAAHLLPVPGVPSTLLYMQDRLATVAAEVVDRGGADTAKKIEVLGGSNASPHWTVLVPSRWNDEPVTLLHSTDGSENIVNLLMSLLALREDRTGPVQVVDTYEGYSRQDKQWVPGQTLGSAALLRVIDHLADRHAGINIHYGDKIVGESFHGYEIFDVNGLTTLAQAMWEQAVQAGFDPAAGQPIVLVAPDDGAYPKVKEAAAALHRHIRDTIGMSCPVHAAYLSKDRADGTTITMEPTLLVGPRKPLVLADGSLSQAWAFVLDDETAQGSTLLSAVYNLVENNGLPWRQVYAGVVHGKLNNGLAPFDTGLSRDESVTALLPAAQTIDTTKGRMPPIKFFTSNSLPLPEDLPAPQLVSIAPLVVEAIRQLGRSVSALADRGQVRLVAQRPPAARLESSYKGGFRLTLEQLPWRFRLTRYTPKYVVDPSVIDHDEQVKPDGWAHPEDFSKVDIRELVSYVGKVKLGGDGKPTNPFRRTGYTGRGLLGRWGANMARDSLVTRRNPQTGHLEMLVIKRRDNEQWAIPGGFLKNGEVGSAAGIRELEEESGVNLDMAQGSRELYRGYMDDPRNTDNAWIETVATWKHLPDDVASRLNPHAGDDAIAVRWMDIEAEDLNRLYAGHGDLVRLLLAEKDSISLPARPIANLSFWNQLVTGGWVLTSAKIWALGARVRAEGIGSLFNPNDPFTGWAMRIAFLDAAGAIRIDPFMPKFLRGRINRHETRHDVREVIDFSGKPLPVRVALHFLHNELPVTMADFLPWKFVQRFGRAISTYSLPKAGSNLTLYAA